MNKFLPLIKRTECYKIWLEDILYIEQDKRILNVVTKNANYTVYKKIGEYEQFLDDRFYHCLKGTVLNFDEVEFMRDQTIYFKNGLTYYIGRENYIRTRQAFARYINVPRTLREIR